MVRRKSSVYALISLATSLLTLALAIPRTQSEPILQPEPNTQQLTIDAYVQQQFALTSQAQQQIFGTQTSEAAFDQARTATLAFQQTLESAFLQAQTATASSNPMHAATATQAARQAAQQSHNGQDANFRIDYSSLNPQRTEDGAFIIGHPDAPITLVEFTDWACSKCIESHITIRRFIRDFVETGLARYEFRMFPTVGGQITVFLGRLAQCADELMPGSFWEVSEFLYDTGATSQYTETAGRTIAERLNLNYGALLNCAEDANQVAVDTEVGSDVGVTSTPSIAVRYGAGPMQWISFEGIDFSPGAVIYEMLAAVTLAANGLDWESYFWAQNAVQDSVITTPSGLQYAIVESGTGPRPTLQDSIIMHYRGTLADGTEFDNSFSDEPLTAPLSGLIQGLQEGIQLMPLGSRYIFYIPPELGYGTRGTPGGSIPPNATMVLEVQLLGIR